MRTLRDELASVVFGEIGDAVRAGLDDASVLALLGEAVCRCIRTLPDELRRRRAAALVTQWMDEVIGARCDS